MEASHLPVHQDRSKCDICVGFLVSRSEYFSTKVVPRLCSKGAADFHSNIIVAILRIIYLANTDFSPNSDFTWDSTGNYVWSVIESSLGVTVACTPVLRPLFYPWLPSLKSSIYSLAGSFTWKRRRENEAYSDISNGEMPLRDLAATFNTGTVAEANAGTPDPTYEEGSEPHSIHVKSEVSVRSPATSSGKALATV